MNEFIGSCNQTVDRTGIGRPARPRVSTSKGAFICVSMPVPHFSISRFCFFLCRGLHFSLLWMGFLCGWSLGQPLERNWESFLSKLLPKPGSLLGQKNRIQWLVHLGHVLSSMARVDGASSALFKGLSLFFQTKQKESTFDSSLSLLRPVIPVRFWFQEEFCFTFIFLINI